MGKLHWYKRDPDAALAGMAELTLAERGAYNSIIDLLYSRGGNVPDDDVLVARMIGCHWREWRAMKARLVERGKVRLEGGKITANRVQEALKEAADFSQDQRRRAAKRWHKSEKDNGIKEPTMPPGNASTTTTTTTTTPTIEPPADAGGVAREARPPPKPRVVKVAIPIGWQPAPETVVTLTAKGYSDHEIAWQRDRFLAHFTDSGERRPGWERSFHNWVTRDPPGRYSGQNAKGNRRDGNGVIASLNRYLGSLDEDEPLR